MDGCLVLNVYVHCIRVSIRIIIFLINGVASIIDNNTLKKVIFEISI